MTRDYLIFCCCWLRDPSLELIQAKGGGMGVNPYGQPDHKKTVFLTTLLSNNDDKDESNEFQPSQLPQPLQLGSEACKPDRCNREVFVLWFLNSQLVKWFVIASMWIPESALCSFRLLWKKMDQKGIWLQAVFCYLASRSSWDKSHFVFCPHLWYQTAVQDIHALV